MLFMRLTLKEYYLSPLYGCGTSMLKISKLSDYATALLARMAQLGVPISAPALAADTRIPPTTVAKLLKQLAKYELVSATRGVSGGYQLSREPKLINIAQVLTALEGPLALTECSAHSGNCVRAGFCGTKRHWRKINQALIAALETVTLAELAAPEHLPERWPVFTPRTIAIAAQV